MKYVAFLRGVNVGGKNSVKMSDLKKLFEEKGFRNVTTYINSGNVIFETEEQNKEKVERNLEKSILKTLKVNTLVILVSGKELKSIVSGTPKNWRTEKDLRKYIAFIKKPFEAKDVMKEIEAKEGVDFAEEGSGVVYMSTLLSGITKSRFTKLITRNIYKYISNRNYNTVQKLLTLIEN
jgi:uncharacterized protein (DUF1697 family)